MEESKNYSMQACQDPDITQDFRNLHTEIVNKVIKFCKDHGIEIDDFYINADGVRGSIPYGEWCPFTDSSFSMYKFDEEHPNMKSEPEPYLWSI